MAKAFEDWPITTHLKEYRHTAPIYDHGNDAMFASNYFPENRVPSALPGTRHAYYLHGNPGRKITRYVRFAPFTTFLELERIAWSKINHLIFIMNKNFEPGGLCKY